MNTAKPTLPPLSAAKPEDEEERPTARERAKAVLHHPLFAAALCGFIAAGAVVFSARGCELTIPKPIQELLIKMDALKERPPVEPVRQTLIQPPPYQPVVRYVQDPGLPPAKPKPPAPRCVTVNTFRICK
jgi:hypothetical protein